MNGLESVIFRVAGSRMRIPSRAASKRRRYRISEVSRAARDSRGSAGARANFAAAPHPFIAFIIVSYTMRWAGLRLQGDSPHGRFPEALSSIIFHRFHAIDSSHEISGPVPPTERGFPCRA